MKHPVPLSFASLCLSLLLICACSPEPDSPEKQVRSLIARAETAAESRDLSALKEMASESYSDRHGNDRQAILGILRYHFLRNETIHLLTRVSELSFPVPDRAVATVFAAMASTPIATPTQIDPLRADIYRFEITLAMEGEGTWRLTGAEWRRAKKGDFF